MRPRNSQHRQTIVACARKLHVDTEESRPEDRSTCRKVLLTICDAIMWMRSGYVCRKSTIPVVGDFLQAKARPGGSLTASRHAGSHRQARLLAQSLLGIDANMRPQELRALRAEDENTIGKPWPWSDIPSLHPRRNREAATPIPRTIWPTAHKATPPSARSAVPRPAVASACVLDWL